METKLKCFVYSLFVLVVIGIAYSCIGYNDSEIDIESAESNVISLKEAKAYFGETMQKVPMERAMGTPSSLVPKEFTPIWEKAISSTQDNLSCLNVPIQSGVRYKAKYTANLGATKKGEIVNVYQKLIIVKDIKNQAVGQYLLSLIPDKRYEAKFKRAVGEKFISCGEKSGFSGIAIYSIPQFNAIFKVVVYADGKIVRGVRLRGTEDMMKKQLKAIKSILSKISVKGKSSIMSRSWEDDWGWDDGDYYPTGGDGGIWIDPDDNWHLVTDYDGDGRPDSFWIPDVEITPDYPNPDPWPDDNNDNWNGNDDDWNNQEDSGNGGGGGSQNNNPNQIDYSKVSVVRISYSKSLFPGYGNGLNCKGVADKIMRQILGNNANIGSPTNVKQLCKEINGKLQVIGNSKDIVKEINRHLEAKHPIVAGVNHTVNSKVRNNDGTTDHFIVIIGRGYDSNRDQLFFQYIETGRSKAQAEGALDPSLRLYYEETSGRIYGRKYNGMKTYDIAQIRPNM